MEYKGKYEEMAEQFRADGADEYTVEKFICQEMEKDEFAKGEGITSLEAVKEWKKIPKNIQGIYLRNAFCINCGVGEFAPGFNLRKDKFRIVIEGTCKKCGGKMTRCVD